MAPGWLAEKKALGLALDLQIGSLLVSADGSTWVSAFESGLCPSRTVGAGLYPAISGSRHAKVRCNFGLDPGQRPMKTRPPSSEYRTIGAASMDSQVAVICNASLVI